MANRVNEIITYYKNDLQHISDFLKLVAGYRDLEQDENSEEHDKILDLILSIYLYVLDITICHKHLLIYREEGNRTEMNYFTRALTMHLFDVLDNSDKTKMINRVKDTAKIHFTNDSTKAFAIKLDEQCKQLLDIKKANLTLLKDIRNNVFTHRDGNGIEQYDMTNNVNENYIGPLSADIKEIIEDIPKNLLNIQRILYPML